MQYDPKNETDKYDRSRNTDRSACSSDTDSSNRLSEMVLPLLQWYGSHARILPWRENRLPYAIWISEIMLQQTRVEAVKPYFDRWMKAFPDLPALASASEAEVLKLWEGLGYYSRARNIHRTAKLVMEKYGGELPSSYEELRSLPGIGEYTAGAVGSIAFRLPIPCVDGNVLRVITRLTAEKADIGTAAAKKLLTGWVREIIPGSRPGDFNQALMELGATVCLPNGIPKCEACPVAFLCEARIQNRMMEFPVKSGKTARKTEKKTVLVILDASDSKGAETSFRTALRKRPDTGLLAGLWEFPNYDGMLSKEEVVRILAGYGLGASSLVKLKNVKHIFSHIEWEMTGYLAFIQDADPLQTEAPGIAESKPVYGATENKTVYGAAPGDVPDKKEPQNQASGFQWVDIDQMEEQLALPAAFKVYYQTLKRYMEE